MLNRHRRHGFTLIEILIVITIIALLAGVVLTAVRGVRNRAMKAKAKTMIGSVDAAARMYETDQGKMPGRNTNKDPDRNDMPKVLMELLPTTTRAGTLEVKVTDVFVMDEEGVFREATTAEFYDPEVDRYIRDPWGEAYIARENKSKKVKEDYMINIHGIDIISKGPDKKEGTEDDIHN